MPKPKLMNRQKILDEIRSSGSYRGGSGLDRKNLFVRPAEAKPLRCWVLPDLRPRGTSGELFPFLTLSTHWVEKKRKDGSKFVGGITCYRALKADEPHGYNHLVDEKLIDPTRDWDCFPCMVLDVIPEDELPSGKFGNPYKARRVHHFQVVLEKTTYDGGDEQKIKILSSGSTGMQSFMSQICDAEFLEEGFFEENGIFSVWRVMAKSWQAQIDARKKIWLEDWKEKLHNLEIVVPVFHSFDEQVAIMLDNLPQHRSKLEKIPTGTLVPKVEKEKTQVPTGKATRSEEKKAARSRIKSAS